MEQIEKPKFSILIIDDEPDSMDTDLTTAKGIVESMDHEYVLHTDQDGKGVECILSEKLIDVIITDKNLIDDELDGIEVVKKIREHNPFVDIIFYSGQGITDSEKEEIRKFHYVQIVDDKEISNELSLLIKKNMAKWDDMSYLRGIVISSIVILEGQVHDFILEYFKIPKEDHILFKTHILENRYFSFEGKKWALSKLIDGTKYPNLLNDLGELQTARNNLAHSHMHETKKNCLKIKGTEETVDKAKITNYIKKGKNVSKQLQELIKQTESRNRGSRTE